VSDSRFSRVASLDDPRVAALRDVRDAALRREHGAFVVEGRLHVDALVRHGRYPVRTVLVTPVAREAMRDTWRALDPATTCLVAEPQLLARVVGYDFHRGCIAVAGRPADVAALELPPGETAPILALEDLSDVDNAGGAFRNALALGAAGVLLSPRCCDPLYRRAIRVSMGAVLRLPWARAEKWPDALIALRTAGRRSVALDPAGEAQALEDFARRRPGAPLVLLAGAEGAGLAQATRSLADARVRIPMARDVDSINVATALAIVLQRLGSSGRC